MKEKIQYVGIDPGVNPAVAVMYKKNIYHVQLQIPKYDLKPDWYADFFRTAKVSSEFMRIFKGELGIPRFPGKVVVALESIAYSQPHRKATLGKIEHEFHRVFCRSPRFDVNHVYMIAPGTWKKHVVGHGHASKEMCRDVIESNPDLNIHGPIGKNFNLSDAICIMLTGRDIYEAEKTEG